MDLEEKYAIGLGVLSIVLWGASFVLGKSIASAPPRVIRTVLPVVALLTLASFAVFVLIARTNVKG
ncbi:MAG: hypothetical protein JO222_09730 [Frankiales bacterium]|nr:hypothetical protein [Frankiales bacterium]